MWGEGSSQRAVRSHSQESTFTRVGYQPWGIYAVGIRALALHLRNRKYREAHFLQEIWILVEKSKRKLYEANYPIVTSSVGGKTSQPGKGKNRNANERKGRSALLIFGEFKTWSVVNPKQVTGLRPASLK